MPLSSNAAHSAEQSSIRQTQMMQGYIFNLSRGEEKVRDMILIDIGLFSGLGACRQVAELCEVLRSFDIAYPIAQLDQGFHVPDLREQGLAGNDAG